MTNGAKINTDLQGNAHILIAPLDWGLGHATRCIPIIKFLTSKGFPVVVAADGPIATLLSREFPTVEILSLPGYGLVYSAGGRKSNMVKIIFQLPKILISIKREHRWLDTVIKKRRIDLVISDCRFGLYHKNVITVLLTHQLTIKSPFKWVERWFRKWNYRFIQRFDECWVPDQEGFPNLAGEISHPNVLPNVPVKYIGCLSRFEYKPHVHHGYDVLIILSGPEPQRTVLENILRKELPLRQQHHSIALVRGLPHDEETFRIPGITVFDHLPANELETLILKSKLVISRSGYTTVMDMVKLHKKSVLVPTPGQPEQEYLAKYLSQHNWCATLQQHEFSLEKALQLAANFTYNEMQELNMDLYQQQIMQTIDTLPHPIFAPKLTT